MSIDEIKVKLDGRKCVFECKIKNTYWIENQNDMNCIHDNKVNNIAEYNLLHDIINPHKRPTH